MNILVRLISVITPKKALIRIYFSLEIKLTSKIHSLEIQRFKKRLTDS